MSEHVPEVHGHCDERFAAVRATFEENFRERGELGAAVTVTVDGVTVADLWGGWADAARTRAWERDTLVNVWSTSKGPTALCAHILADRGLLDLDAPVADYWPEFAAAGKEGVLVRHLLSHRAGLAGLREPHTLEQLYDWELTTARLAATEPWWEPGTRSGYHALTYGFLVGEDVRAQRHRALRRRPHVDQRVALPGAGACRVGPAAPQVHDRLAADHDAHRGAQLGTVPEVLLERRAHCREARVTVAVDRWLVLGHGPSVVAGSPDRDTAIRVSRTYRLVGLEGRFPAGLRRTSAASPASLPPGRGRRLHGR